jgi:hypothetical protein
VGFVVDKVALGQFFLDYFGSPRQFSFHRLLHIHHLSSDIGTIGQLLTGVPNRLSLALPQECKKEKILIVAVFFYFPHFKTLMSVIIINTYIFSSVKLALFWEPVK